MLFRLIGIPIGSMDSLVVGLMRTEGDRRSVQAFLLQSVEGTTLNRVFVDGMQTEGGLENAQILAFLAQSVERTTLNRVVVGSIPTEGVHPV
jgi:hypothetical protein